MMCNEIVLLKRRIAELEKQQKKILNEEPKNSLNQRKREIFNSYFGDTQSIKKLASEEIWGAWKKRDVLLGIVKNLTELLYKNTKGNFYTGNGKQINLSTCEDIEMYLSIYENACVNISSIYFKKREEQEKC